MLPSARILLPVLLVVTSIAVAGGFFVGDSLAIFTNQETNAANTISAGNIVLDDAPDSAFLTVADLIPGDSTIQPLTITNAGVGALRYSMTTAADNVDTKNLRDQLQLTLRLKTANPCSSEDGAIISGPGILTAGAFGSAAQGADPGDRALGIAASEVLCFKAELPLASDDTYQNATTTATFTFDAEQTSNNP